MAKGARAVAKHKEFGRFLRYALNSSSELEHHLIVARDTKVIPEGDFVALVSQTITVRKMLYGLLSRLSMPKSDSTNEPRDSPQPKTVILTAPSR